jgi:hypothetical protein
MKTNKIALALSAAFSMAAATEASALTNISFESGLTGWTSSGNGATTTLSTTYSNAGSLMAKMIGSSNSGDGVLSQFGLPALGAGYTLYYNFTEADSKDWFKVDYSLTTSGPTSWSNLVNLTNSGSSSIAIPLGATGLRFTLHDDKNPKIPTATFDVSPVPEPGEWAMMLAGFGLIGLMANRKRRRSV